MCRYLSVIGIYKNQMRIPHGSLQYQSECDDDLTVFWCRDGMANSGAGAVWHMPLTPTNVTCAISLPSKVLCFCTQVDNCTRWSPTNSNCEEVFYCQYDYQMMQNEGSYNWQTQTLSFTYSVYGNNGIDNPTKTQESLPLSPLQVITTSSLMECSCSLQETPCSNLLSILSLSISSSLSSSISSSCSSTMTEQVSSTTPLLTISSSCSSTVTEQVSTTPYYAGIGLLVATNLITIILLISSCVYIFSQRKKSKL